MTDFKGGGIPVPDYDKEDINFINQKTEFTDDVFVYGKLYAEFGGDVQTFSTAGNERVRITPSGQFLVGATSADVDNKMLIQDSGTTILKINNTDDGTSQITLANTGSSNGQIKQISGDMTFSIAGNEKARITSNGRIGINTDSPSRLLEINTTGTSTEGIVVKAHDNTYPKLQFGANRTTADAFLGLIIASWNDTDVASIHFETGSDTTNKDDGLISFRTASSGGNREERFRINSDSGVKITVKDDSNDNNISDKTAILIENGGGAGDIGDSLPTHIDWAWVDSNNNATPQCRISGNVGDGGDPDTTAKEGKGFLTFHCSDTSASSGVQDPPQRLRIAHNGTFTGSSSNNISDQRLKENIATITDPITKIKALKGRTFTWKSEASMREGTHYGFVAQEVESVIPDLIVDDTGIRIFDKDNNLQPSNVITPPVGGGYAKSVDSDGVTPVLVEALKEALSKIETLEAKVAALEGS